MNKLNDLMKVVKNKKTKRLAVAACQDEEVLKAVIEAAEDDIVEPILIGDIDVTKNIASENGLDVNKYEMIDCKDLQKSAEIAVKKVKNNEADFVMKGLIDTSILLKEVLNKEYGLRTESLLSHVMVYEVPAYHKLILLSDGGMNISPSIDEKLSILKNAIKVSHSLGCKQPKVAVLAAKEKVNPKMEATIDAEKLKKMWISEDEENTAIVQGPMALDLAISKKACEVKKYKSEVAGDADILIVPNIEMGNGIGKSMTYFGQGKSAGIIMGAKVPVVLVSRADTHESKLYSIALGSVIA
ncbi:bifunctional enoyl-CoA hydratase/phosphate acetyltransferase [Clostridiisalibacter paucivorans]|uniref:bifunctional enoyl-CoA hydratase/phosphate acetyltransferase n=1 Tax=Clostridiisalibacter paucivorans TaxID=408753 RepID=UPI00047A4C60|nr:bifunctional enoyl-CoA hydratase/phosphate acetyltransferase [Clostridiisalibacter paucivorans]